MSADLLIATTGGAFEHEDAREGFVAEARGETVFQLLRALGSP